MNRSRKCFVATGLSLLLIAAQAVGVSADYDDDIANVQAQQAQTNADLSEVQNSINEMETEKEAVLAKIDGYDQELVVTIASIKSLEDQIAQAEKDLEQTGKELEKANADQETQYNAMKKRIQYLYEEGGENGWADIMLGDTDLSSGLNQVDDTQSLYKFDRQELTNYTNTVQKVTELQKQQTEQKSNLETMRQEQEAAKANLEDLKAQAQAQSADYETQIADAEETANAYYALIVEQNQQIAELQAKKAAEEEAKRKAAEEAARKQAEEEARRQAEAQAQAEAQQQAAAQTAAYDSGSGSSVSVSGGVTGNTGISGSDIANYALQFVGNPYVWGGTSLTNGADCSGFVQSVFKHFGINLSRTTYSQANEGVAVSYSDMQPGDVINYGHHTAIYIGNNMIVHAATSQLGIITQSNPAFEPIVTIRRFY